MKKIHYLSGIIISLFIVLHLFNHLFSLFGIESHIEMMNNLRYIYRNIFVEVILLSLIMVQITSGMRLFVSKIKTAVSVFDKLQIWTGLYMGIFFIFHLTAVFSGRFLLNLDTNFYFGTAGLNTFPFNLFFIPYYGFAITSFFGHIAAIHHHKMKYNILGFNPSQQATVILFSGIILTFIIFYGLTNKFQGIDVPAEYNILINK